MRNVFLSGFLVLLAAVPLAQMAFGPAPPVRLLGMGHRAQNLREFERRLDEESIFVIRARPVMQRLMFPLREAGEKVLVDPDGVLFYRQDVHSLTQPVRTADAFQAIVSTHAQLSRRGIRLVVMPVPVKPHRPEIRTAAQQLLRELGSAGVDTIDLSAEPREYLKFDTHWTPATARSLARFVAPKLGIEPGVAVFGEREVPAARRGDLAQMLSIRGQFPPEIVTAWKVEGHVSAVDSPLLVLGDSFLRIYETDTPEGAGFLSHLARALRRPVASIVNDGGASTLVRQDLARRSSMLTGKKVVLWEFVERDLRFGAEGWREVILP